MWTHELRTVIAINHCQTDVGACCADCQRTHTHTPRSRKVKPRTSGAASQQHMPLARAGFTPGTDPTGGASGA
eukprot:7556238-Alexandrium_andersonii.AAC.1